MRKTLWSILSIVLFLTMAIHSQASGLINGAGATFPYPVYSSWAYSYYKNTGIKVNYQGIGSGGGIRQITKRVVDFGGSDKMLSPKELKKRGLYQFPAVVGSIVVVQNLNGIKDCQLNLSNKTAADIFMGKIKYWDNKEIKHDNPNIKLPHKIITVVHRSEGSGTTWNFTYWLSHISEDWNNKIGFGKIVDWPTGKGAKGNQGVTNYVKQIPGSIGYVEYAYKIQNNLKTVKLQTADGNFIAPSDSSFKSAAKQASWSADTGFYINGNLLLAKGRKSWPLTVATMILLAKDRLKANKKAIAFYDWAFKNRDSTASRLGYVPLPKSTKTAIRHYWKEMVLK